MIKNIDEEILFHVTLKENQNEIFNFKYSFKIEDISLNNKQIKMNDGEDNIKITNNNNNETYEKTKKDFSNMLLAYYQNKQIDNDVNVFDISNKDKLFIKLKISEILEDVHFKKLLEDYCSSNGISKIDNSYENFINDCARFLEKHCLGSLIDELGVKYLEINLYVGEIVNAILGMFKENCEELNIMTIYKSLTSYHYYNMDYIRYILRYMVDKYLLYFDYSRSIYTKAYLEI